MTSLAGLEISGGNDPCLSNLPCLGSRSIIAGWYSVVDDALRASNHAKVLKLYEAALCIPLRVRCGPSLKQVSLDSTTYSEDLFAFNSASSDAFLTFAEKVMSALPADFLQSRPVKNIVVKAESLGISFHGSAVGDSVARALINVAPFVICPEFQMAFMSHQTKISFLTHACTKIYGKAGSAATGASVKMLIALRLGLMYKDIAKESHLTKEF